MAPIDKLLMHSSQEVMRCSLQMVFQWTEELSIRTNGANCKASLTNGDFFLPMVPLVAVSLTRVSNYPFVTNNKNISLHLHTRTKQLSLRLIL